ncbi:MAG: nicotinate-nicotinamide nucleotide adenylyltransferase [Phycisphaerales bacterium]|nr:nicotinate-nicotinamide nucleotide adenylyltransferase [Phycisphaerales bacterium]
MTQRHGVPTGIARLLVYGGTFDPPHRAHLELAGIARESLGVQWLLFAPAARSPHRDTGPVAPLEARARMLEAALPDAACSVTRVEQELADACGGDGSVRTVDLLTRLRADLGSATAMRLLIGADQAVAFHRWARPDEVIGFAEPAVLLRAPWDTPDRLIDALTPHWPAPEIERWRRRIVEAPVVEVSATPVRAALRAGRTDDPVVAAALPETVRALIRAGGWYTPA